MKDSKTASYLYEKYKEYKFHKKIKGYDFLMKTNKKYHSLETFLSQTKTTKIKQHRNYQQISRT